MTNPVPESPARSVESQLIAYRDLVLPLVTATFPGREPRQYLYDLIAGQLSRGGKGIRPALCIATCRALGGTTESALPSAAALELLHNAFLVHDDIEDESEYRRDEPTLHRRVGVPLAVNVGDAMNAMTLRVLKQNLELLGPETTWRIFDEFDHMMIETIEGQAMELGWIRDNRCDTTEEDYLLMVLKKTCWYSFIHPCRIGALIAKGDDVDLGGFDRFGYYLGIAFQIQDDLLNLVGERGKYGKEIGGDILEGKRTLVLAHLFRSSGAPHRERLRAFFAKPRGQRLAREVAWVYQLMRDHGSLEHARRVARDFAAAAAKELELLYRSAPAASDADAGFLRSLVDHMVLRDA